jgi:hypothetical protein
VVSLCSPAQASRGLTPAPDVTIQNGSGEGFDGG